MRVNTEEEGVDGAQAIENETDSTDEYEALCTPSIDPILMHSPILNSTAKNAVKYNHQTFTQEHSSFGIRPS